MTSFESLPDSARVWVYGADNALDQSATETMLAETDSFLQQWQAHGHDLLSARSWSEDRFLTIGVDQETEGASGCSIDVLFRALKALEPKLGAHIVTSGLVYFRGRDGTIQSVTRDEFSELGARGDVDGKTEVFDLSVTTLGEWRARFRSRAENSWHGSLIPERAGA